MKTSKSGSIKEKQLLEKFLEFQKKFLAKKINLLVEQFKVVVSLNRRQFSFFYIIIFFCCSLRKKND